MKKTQIFLTLKVLFLKHLAAMFVHTLHLANVYEHHPEEPLELVQDILPLPLN